MKYTIYEDPITHRFALIKVPTPFVDGDTLPIPPAARWFDTLEEAQATLPLLFIQEA
jgi:hypothetical protein